MNAYMMYEKMYEQEKTGHREMPKKWTHQEFLLQLIYDFMGMTEMPAAEVDDESTQVATRSMTAAVQSNMSSASVKYNLGTDKGRLAYCQEVRTHNVTVNRMEDNWFKDRTNGRYHPSIENAFEGAYCQYCRFKWQHRITNERTKTINKWMFNYRAHIKRCLVCNVNLCWSCFNDWHGFSIGALNSMARQK